MPEIFPLTGSPKDFIPTAQANFFESIIDDILAEILYPQKREFLPGDSFPTILTMNRFVEPFTPDAAMDKLDKFCAKRWSKFRLHRDTGNYALQKMYREYSDLKPTCFLVVGEPSEERYEAAKIFAKMTRRVHLDVTDLVNLEMSKESQCGKWIYTNLVEGSCIPVSVVLHLLEMAIRQSEVQNAGYILTGFPIIPYYDLGPDRLPQPLYKMKTLKTPPSEITQNWRKDKGSESHILTQSYSENSRMSANKSEESLTSSQQNLEHLPSEASSSEETVEEIKYIKSVSTERDSWGSDSMLEEDYEYLETLMNDRNLQTQLQESDIRHCVWHQLNFLLSLELDPDVVFFIRRKCRDTQTTSDVNVNLSGNETTSTSQSSCEDDNLTRQRERYEQCLPEIEWYLLHFCKESIIVVDTRFSSEETATQFMTAMAFTNYKFSLVPQKVVLDKKAKLELMQLSPAKRLAFMCRYQCIQPNLLWRFCDVGPKCPVALQCGKAENGKLEYAVRYFGQLFFCSSIEARSRFLRTPDRYCSPKPNCRIAIIKSAVRQLNGIISLYQSVFNAKTFRWKDILKDTPDVGKLDIHKEAIVWAEKRVKQNEVKYVRAYGAHYLQNFGDSPKVKSLNTVKPPFSLRRATAGPGDMLFQDVYNKMLEFKFYQLYKEKYAYKIADQTIAWLRSLDGKFEYVVGENQAQWILADVPTELEYWEKLEESGFLPDVVIVLSDNFDTTSNMLGSVDYSHLDIQSRCSQIALTFPSLIKNVERNLFDLVSKAIGQDDDDEDVISILSSEDNSSDADDSHYEHENKERPFEEVIDFLEKRNVPVLVSDHTGKVASLEVLESYLTLFKEQPVELEEETLNNLREVCQNSYPKDPELPGRIFTSFKAIYALDLQYLKKGAVFDYNQLLRNYEKSKFSDETENEEVEEGEKEGDDPSLDIEVLSQENIKSMEELESLRQLPLGNSGVYCPVLLRDRKCLRLGRLNLTVTYHGFHYCMSTPDAHRAFMKCAFPYTYEERRPSVPPYRIFVIGPAGPNRSNFMQMLSKRLNTKSTSYSKLMSEYLNQESVRSDTVFCSEDEIFETHGRGFLQTTLRERYRRGILCEGFPKNLSQLQGMIHFKLFPELVYIIDEDPNDALHFAFLQGYIQWEKRLKHKYDVYLKKLSRLAEKHKMDDSDDLGTRIRQETDDVKMELDKINERIKMQEDEAYAKSFTTESQEVVSSSIGTKYSLELQAVDAGKKLMFSKEFYDEESTFEEESDQRLTSPLPTTTEKVKQTQKLLRETKKAIREEIFELKKVIKMLISEKVPVISIPIYCSKRNCEFKLQRYDHESRKNIFEQVIIVSPNAANTLLSTGYALYSHFKNYCPVDVYNLMPINRHFSMKKQNKLYAVLYRHRLFYINGSENLVRFYSTPIMYTSKAIPFVAMYPSRILVMGPVCSGVTTLCERVSFEFNFKVMGKTEFTQFVAKEKLKGGKNSSTSNALIEFIHHYKHYSENGLVLDNLSLGPEDLINAARANVCFNLVLIIKCEFWAIWRNWRSAYLQDEPYKCVSVTDELSKLYSSFRRYLKMLNKYTSYDRELDLFNIVYLKNAASKWGLWEEAKNEMIISLRGIGSYFKNIRQQQVVSLSRLNIFRSELNRRLSPVKLFCPTCLKASKLVKYKHYFHNVGLDFYSPSCQKQFNQPFGYNNAKLYQLYGFPKLDTASEERKPLISKNMFKKNLVQYRHNFYWTCDKHYIDILLSGPSFLPPDPLSYPGYIPFLVTNYYRKDVVNEGFCVVTYVRQLPKKVYTLGDPSYAVFYRGKIFLCTSEDCAVVLLENPEHYYNFHMPPYERPYEDLDLKDININYGHLTPEKIIEALKALARSRPKHLALSIRDSAAIFVGLYLKTINPVSRAESIRFNEELYSKFVSECSYLEWLIKKFNRSGNPHIMQ